jgi:hydrogenase expression/formation protein HypC
MCLSLPGEVVTVRDAVAEVETLGMRRWCNALLFGELSVGDRVLVHAGLIVQVLSAEEAREMEAAFAELGVVPD